MAIFVNGRMVNQARPQAGTQQAAEQRVAITGIRILNADVIHIMAQILVVLAIFGAILGILFALFEALIKACFA